MKGFFLILFLASSLHAKNILIGIAGGTAAGKTSFATRMQNEYFPGAAMISLDAYGIEMPTLSLEEKMSFNWDSPEAVDVDLFVEHLIALKNGLSIEQPVPKFDTFSRESFKVLITPTPVILVEGLHLLSIPQIRDLLNIKIFLDVGDDIRLLRRIDRDIRERGGDLSTLLSQYLKNIKPMHDLFIEPSKQYADIIITQDKLL